MNLLANALLAWAIASPAAPNLSVETTRHGPAVEVRAYALVEALHATVWGTVTDYDRLAQFVPGMRSSRVVAQRNGDLVVEQHGETRFLFFHHPVDVTLLATARPPDAVEVHLLSGNLKRLDGVYRLESAGPGRIALRWTGLIEPDNLPPLLGELVMRATIEAQFTGMVREIERREALRGKAR
ncbi:MAG: SRPBCC family protein [Betaproteobacteria bacterium]|nr:SRPBCC family protein [Betaproteobacteria bacterium]MDH5350425.1 SRPBCC family protein [Betaproteobacteria bacterium]